MNELYALDPTACEHPGDLQSLLRLFGPPAGRYVAAYPTDWSTRVTKHVDGWAEIQRARAMTLIRRAKESGALVHHGGMWNPQGNWTKNAMQLLQSGSGGGIDGLIVPRNSASSPDTRVKPVDELELPPTAEERINANDPREFARVSKILVSNSVELVFVDPYLDLGSGWVLRVLRALSQAIRSGNCEQVKMWARKSCVVEPQGRSPSNGLRQYVKGQLAGLGFGREVGKVGVEYLLVDDRECSDRMHGRYLLSAKGGLRLEQGFQTLRPGQLMDVVPLGGTHAGLWSQFGSEKTDIRIVDRITI